MKVGNTVGKAGHGLKVRQVGKMVMVLKWKGIERARQYSQSVRWQFAKTMPETPHEYTVRQWRPDKEADYDWFAKVIYRHGRDQLFMGKKYRYLYVDAWKYWSLGIIINRARHVAPRSTIPTKDVSDHVKNRRGKADEKA